MGENYESRFRSELVVVTKPLDTTIAAKLKPRYKTMTNSKPESKPEPSKKQVIETAQEVIAKNKEVLQRLADA